MVLESSLVGGTLPKRRPLASRAAGQETLLSDPENGKVHFFNPTAALVWDCCDGQTTAEQCVCRLRAAFAIPDEADVAADVRAVIDDLKGRGLLERDGVNA